MSIRFLLFGCKDTKKIVSLQMKALIYEKNIGSFICLCSWLRQVTL